MLNPDDRWIWDFWHVQDGDIHHLFYLQAPVSLGDPELRHRNATIGHATSTDLTSWTEHGTVLRPGAPGAPGAPDATATWTGSIVRDDDGMWRMFYTGSTFLDADSTANVEVVTAAVSKDLHVWTKDPNVVVRADPRWYEVMGDSTWPEEAWRDPWVYRDADGLWHMLITARANTGPVAERGVVGHAISDDLKTWSIQPPLAGPGKGFAHLEVFQRLNLHGQTMLVFAAHDSVLSAERLATGATTGTWVAPWDSDIDLVAARNLTGPELYSGRVIVTGAGPVLLGFRVTDSAGEFVGGICDPLPLTFEDGELTIRSTADAS